MPEKQILIFKHWIEDAKTDQDGRGRSGIFGNLAADECRMGLALRCDKHVLAVVR